MESSKGLFSCPFFYFVFYSFPFFSLPLTFFLHLSFFFFFVLSFWLSFILRFFISTFFFSFLFFFLIFFSRRMDSDGYFLLDNEELTIPEINISTLSYSIVKLLQYGWPPTFFNIYDEAWIIVNKIRIIIEKVTGNSPNMDLLSWYQTKTFFSFFFFFPLIYFLFFLIIFFGSACFLFLFSFFPFLLFLW